MSAVVVGGATAADAQVADLPVCLWSDADFLGEGWCGGSLSDDVADINLPDKYNDRTSSVRVRPGYVVTLFTDGDFKGPSIEISGDVADLSLVSDLNDEVSSFRVEGPPIGPVTD